MTSTRRQLSISALVSLLALVVITVVPAANIANASINARACPAYQISKVRWVMDIRVRKGTSCSDMKTLVKHVTKTGSSHGRSAGKDYYSLETHVDKKHRKFGFIDGTKYLWFFSPGGDGSNERWRGKFTIAMLVSY